MRKIWNKGHRIRASDKHLVYHFSIGMLLVVFVAVLLLLNIKQLMRTDWEHFSLLEKLKRVVKGIVRNYRKELKRRRNKEISYCELPEIVVEKLAVWDEYESDYTAFDVCGIEVRVLDDDLAEAIKYLSEKDREILLMYFFLGMSDTEIGDRLKINRSTSFRSRKNSLEELKKKLKENMNDE